MGFYSWKTNDTNRSIANKYSDKETFTVYMHDHEGRIYTEENYEGYGVFGGKDYYVLVAEMNGNTEGSDEEKRSLGVTICCNEPEYGILFPQLTESKDPPDPTDFFIEPASCEHQGFFYPDKIDSIFS